MVCGVVCGSILWIFVEIVVFFCGFHCGPLTNYIPAPRSYDFTYFFVYNFDVGLHFHGEKNDERIFLTLLYIRIIIFYRKKSIFLTSSNP